MRFMMLMYPGPHAEVETSPVDTPDGAQLLDAMMAFNQRMLEAGIMLGGDGLKPTRFGARVKYGPRGSVSVIDGPFTETKEILGGYWMIECGSLAEAVSWARQAPCPAGEFIEIREMYEAIDFGPDAEEKVRVMMDEMSKKPAS
jgi:hypothetical protein